MSSPSNPNPPGRSTGNPESRPGVSPTDQTRTQWAQPVTPPATGPATGPRSTVSPADPTLTHWQGAQAIAEPQPVAEPGPSPVPPSKGKTRRGGARSFFWPGFAVGFLLLTAVSCGALTAALGFNRLTLDDIRGANGTAWTPMPVTPAAVVAAPAAGESEPAATGASTRFVAGQSAANVTNSRVNIRLTPGYLGKAGSDVIGQLEAGQTLQILGDPTPADELTWWRIQATSGGQTVVGWVAESTASGVQILGSTP